jgi:uncharacterized protein
MKIRSITCFVNPRPEVHAPFLQAAGAFTRAASAAYAELGIKVQTTRLAAVPFPHLFPGLERQKVVDYARQLEAAASNEGIAYVSLGPALPELPASYPLVVDILEHTQNVFVAAVIASQQSGISLPAVRRCGEIITRLSAHDPNGFGNLYFAALANVPPGAPFFPAAYHAGDQPAFALALEAAGLAVDAFSAASSLEQARHNLIQAVETQAALLVSAAEKLAAEYRLNFLGLDFTLAPFPSPLQSLGTALAALGVPTLGLSGTLAAAAFLADALDRASFPRTGFNGLMLPVLEDSALAEYAARGSLTVRDLLMASAVCGTGLDTVPLPGDTSPEAISALLLDLAALSRRLDKPLTARLMPVPGKKAGDATSFDFPFFANSRVMALEASPLLGLFAGEEAFDLSPRPGVSPAGKENL